MTLAAAPLSALPLAAETVVGSSFGAGALAPFSGFGVQGSSAFRGERFRVTETRARWRARESDSQEMLGTTDKSPLEKVWYEVDFLDVLHGASIIGLTVWVQGTMLPLSQQTESNGEQVNLVKVLIAGVAVGEVSKMTLIVQCSDGAVRARSLKVRGREL